MPRSAKLALAVATSGLAVAVLAGAVLSAGDETSPRNDQLPRTVAKPKGKPVVLAFGGDVHFEGVVASNLAANPSGVLDPIEPVLRQADLSIVNLETAVTAGSSPTPKAFVFRAPQPRSRRYAAVESTSRRWRTTTGSTTARRAFATPSPRRGPTASRSSASD